MHGTMAKAETMWYRCQFFLILDHRICCIRVYQTYTGMTIIMWITKLVPFYAYKRMFKNIKFFWVN